MRRNERGAVLIVSLIMLSVVTMLALSSMQMSTMQVRMAKNFQDGMSAFSEAENGLSDARHQLEDDLTVAGPIVDEIIANRSLHGCSW